MIVPMSKVFIAARACDRQRLLDALRELGVVHLAPIDPSRAVADELLVRRIETLRQALQALTAIEPQGTPPEMTPGEAAHEVMEIERRAAEGRSRLAALYHQLEQIDVWGDLRLDDIEQLRRSGVHVRFFAMPKVALDEIEADCVAVVGEMPGRQILVATASRQTEPVVPEPAVSVPLPPRDAQSIRAEAKQIDAGLHEDIQRLHALAGLVPRMQAELLQLDQQRDEVIAIRGAAADEDIFTLQGWTPEETAPLLDEQLAARAIPVALRAMEPDADELPPTLVRPPAWARPIEGLFNILGTVPGYREFDISIPFLIALPLFTAMLISDGGYGALLLLAPALAYRRVTGVLGARFTQLLMVVGAISIVWGVLTNTFFGFPVLPKTLITIDQSEASRLFMMKLSFTIGAVHLSLAQLWQAVRLWPNLRAWNNIGWGVFIWGMYGVVNMFVLKEPLHWGTPWPYLLIVGASLAIVFASPSRNPLKMLVLGVAQFPLSMLSAFSDVISYVRLMAVGLASSVLAVSFNDMAFDAGAWPLTIMILVLGHGLNLALAMIAMFAHGVRLNMLEFSNNLGMRWTGFPYQPFTQRSIQEYTR